MSAESSGAAGGQEFRVRSATLWLKADIRHARSAKCKSTELYVFKFLAALPRSVKINSKEFSELTEDPVAVQLDETASGWQKVDLTRTVRQWLESTDSDRLRLFVDCACCSNWQVRLFNGDSADPDRPFLVVHTDPTTTKRVRRRALDCGVDSGNACCKQRFYVSFKELGWDDWIIAPQGYYANYCRGDCGHHRGPEAYATYHTHVLEEVRKTHHLSGMQPCCAPLKFSSMSLIYYGPDSNIIKRDLPKMVVDECGCP